MRAKRIITSICILLAICNILPCSIDAKKQKKSDIDIYELSIDENISSPQLGKQSKNIVLFQSEQITPIYSLISKGYPYTVETQRNGEVIAVTIQARHLFKPNEYTLSDNGMERLKPLLKYLKSENLYKMVIAMHSDNTGNNAYSMDITTKRVNSVFDWIANNKGIHTELVVPYALGNSDPIVDNNSIINRDKNRRLVIYLIPEKGMISQAKKGYIKL